MTTVIDSLSDMASVFNDVSSVLVSADYSASLRETADDFREIHAGYFDSESGPGGVAWEKWHFRTLWAPHDHMTLNVTGRLRQSLISGPDHVEEVDSRALTFGTSVPYSWQNNEGGTFSVSEMLVGRNGAVKRPGDSITIPQREHVGIVDADVDRIANRVADQAVDILVSGRE